MKNKKLHTLLKSMAGLAHDPEQIAKAVFGFIKTKLKASDLPIDMLETVVDKALASITDPEAKQKFVENLFMRQGESGEQYGTILVKICSMELNEHLAFLLECIRCNHQEFLPRALEYEATRVYHHGVGTLHISITPLGAAVMEITKANDIIVFIASLHTQCAFDELVLHDGRLGRWTAEQLSAVLPYMSQDAIDSIPSLWTSNISWSDKIPILYEYLSTEPGAELLSKVNDSPGKAAFVNATLLYNAEIIHQIEDSIQVLKQNIPEELVEIIEGYLGVSVLVSHGEPLLRTDQVDPVGVSTHEVGVE